MKNETKNNFQKIEKEIRKLISILNSVKDENKTLKIKAKELETFKSSFTKDISKRQKVASDFESLKNKYDKLMIEKNQLRERVDQMLKKLDALQLY